MCSGIQYSEEDDPMYRHAGIDIYLGTGLQGQGAGTEAVELLARYLFSERGHHRITIDPAAITNGPSAAMPRWASGRSGSCASTSAAPAANSTTAS